MAARRDRHLAQAHDLALGQQHLALVVAPASRHGAHVGDRDLQPGADVGVEASAAASSRAPRAAGRRAVEALDVLAQRGVAARAHVGDDLPDARGDRRGPGASARTRAATSPGSPSAKRSTATQPLHHLVDRLRP
jgi:hypothetical protein